MHTCLQADRCNQISSCSVCQVLLASLGHVARTTCFLLLHVLCSSHNSMFVSSPGCCTCQCLWQSNAGVGNVQAFPWNKQVQARGQPAGQLPAAPDVLCPICSSPLTDAEIEDTCQSMARCSFQCILLTHAALMKRKGGCMICLAMHALRLCASDA